ncbi:MAG: hypothetical protein ACRYGK_18735 [Janthinobacterium lividum]
MPLPSRLPAYHNTPAGHLDNSPPSAFPAQRSQPPSMAQATDTEAREPAVQPHGAALLANGRNAATLVGELFDRQSARPATIAEQALVKQAAYRLLRVLTNRPPLSPLSAESLMTAQRSIEAVSHDMFLGACNNAANQKESQFQISAYNSAKRALIIELVRAFHLPASCWHGLWPASLRQRLMQLQVEDRHRFHVLQTLVCAAVSLLSKNAQCADLTALAMIDEGMHRDQPASANPQGLSAGDTDRMIAQLLRCGEAGDHVWLEILSLDLTDGAAALAQPHGDGLDIVEDGWADEKTAVFRSEAAFPKSSRYLTKGLYSKDLAHQLAELTVDFSRVLAQSTDLRTAFAQDMTEFQPSNLISKGIIDVLDLLARNDIPIDRLYGCYSQRPSVFSSAFRSDCRQALRELDTSAQAKRQLARLARKQASEAGGSNAFCAMASARIIEQAKEIASESRVRTRIIGDAVEFDRMRLQLPPHPVALIHILENEPDLKRLRMGLMHLKDRLQEEPNAALVNEAASALLQWWCNSQHVLAVDVQILNIASDDRIFETRSYQVWSAVLCKILPSMTPECPATPYYFLTVKSMLASRLKLSAQQRHAEIELFRQQFLPALKPRLLMQLKTYPAFYQKHVTPLLSAALHLPGAAKPGSSAPSVGQAFA